MRAIQYRSDRRSGRGVSQLTGVPDHQGAGAEAFHGYLKDLDGKLAGKEWFSDEYSALDPYGLVFYVWGVRRGACRWVN